MATEMIGYLQAASIHTPISLRLDRLLRSRIQ